jgi:hypothetical protein
VALTVAMEGHCPTRFPSGWGRRYTTADLPLAVFFLRPASASVPKQAFGRSYARRRGVQPRRAAETDIAPANRYLGRGLMSGSPL